MTKAFLSDTHKPQPGDALDNGATVLAFKRLPDTQGHHPGGIVLALTEGYHPFVTWIFVAPPDRPAFCTNGHYYESVFAAAIDFEARR